MQFLTTALLASLPLSALAGLPHVGSLRRSHYDHARKSALNARAGTFKLVDDYNNSTFLEYVFLVPISNSPRKFTSIVYS